MNELLAKLTNLGYEFFGVILPGIIAVLFGVLWWNALGILAAMWTNNVVPEFTVQTARSLVESLNIASGIGVAVPGFALIYFAGHLVFWISRSGEPSNIACRVGWRRVTQSLMFKIPKPEANFSAKLQGLYDKIQQKFAGEGVILEWREFYPVAKSFLSQTVTTSLVATYQNKYTLHRSITTISSLLFWFCAASLIGAVYASVPVPPSTYGGLVILMVLALLLVWGFSSSYIYNWEMFGNTVITEAYSRLYGPPVEPKK